MAVVASAPGKVLMTGGYLVLEKPNAGLVLSTNARFYAIVKPINEEVKPESWAWVCILFSFMCYWEVILLQH
jgi:phosphomevalonate kinase